MTIEKNQEIQEQNQGVEICDSEEQEEDENFPLEKNLSKRVPKPSVFLSSPYRQQSICVRQLPGDAEKKVSNRIYSRMGGPR